MRFVIRVNGEERGHGVFTSVKQLMTEVKIHSHFNKGATVEASIFDSGGDEVSVNCQATKGKTMRCYESIINDLRGGDHHKRPTVLGGVKHDERCLEAADDIEKLISKADSNNTGNTNAP
jgi:hypothetical protein